MGSQRLAGFSQGDQGGFRGRVTIDPATDRREGDACHTVLHGQLEAGAVAGGQQLGFLCVSTVPYRTDGVDNPAGSQVEARSDAGFAGRTAAQACAVRPQAWARGAVYGAIHAAAAQKAGVGGIDDGIDGETGDVSLPEGNAVGRVHGSPPGQLHLYVMTPSSSARNLSEVAASIRLVLMLPLREAFSRSRFITMCRTTAKLLAAKPVRTVDWSSPNWTSRHQWSRFSTSQWLRTA